jgi:hypothetical protein
VNCIKSGRNLSQPFIFTYQNKIKKLKVIQVYKPQQDSNTKDEDLELVEFVTTIKEENIELKNIVPHWCVRSEMLKHNESYHQWLLRKKEQILTGKYVESGVEGIYLYDVITVDGMIRFDEDNNQISQCGMMVRYDYIKTK